MASRQMESRILEYFIGILVRKGPAALGLVVRDGFWGGFAAWEGFGSHGGDPWTGFLSPWRSLDPHGEVFIPMEKFGSSFWESVSHGEVCIPVLGFISHGEFGSLVWGSVSPWRSLDLCFGGWYPMQNFVSPIWGFVSPV